MKKGYKAISCLLAAALAVSTFTTPAVKKQVKAAEVTTVPVATFDFEGEDTEGWEPRGTETASISKDAHYTGAQCAKASDRTKTWHGISRDITSLLEDGESYTLKVWVMYDNSNYGNQQSMTLSVATTVNGKETYTNLKSQNVYVNNWTLFEGAFTYNSSMEVVKMYMEGGTHDFYIDNASVNQNAPASIQQDITSLKDVFAPYDCKVGTAVTVNELNSSEKAIIAKHFNSITVGNEMKPDAVLDYDATVAYMEETGDDTTPMVSFTKAAPILKYCEANGIEIRGHVLAWHSQTPRWFFAENFSQDSNAALVSKEVMLQRLENYIKAVFETLAEEYPNLKIYTWDVVNEALENNGNGYRPAGTTANTSSSLWMQVIGEDFIEAAFTYARKYAPAGTLLAYNDYNEYMPAKRDLMYKIASGLKEKGLIDVIGMQMHLSTSYPTVSMFESAVRKFASIEGIKIEITEFDMTTYDSSENGMKAQGEKYKAYFDCIKKLMAEGIDFNSITLWGVRDTDSWRASQYPCVFDENYQAKPAFYGIVGDGAVTPAPSSEAPATTVVPTSETPATTVAPTSAAPTSETPATSIAPVDGAPAVSVKTNIGSNISQTYTITPSDGKAVDTSKLVIRYNYTKDGSKGQSFWCDNAGVQMSVSPYYVAFTQNVVGTFGDGYLEISFSKDVTFDTGSLSLQVRFNQEDWSAYTGFIGGDMEVYYDGVRVQ